MICNLKSGAKLHNFLYARVQIFAINVEKLTHLSDLLSENRVGAIVFDNHDLPLAYFLARNLFFFAGITDALLRLRCKQIQFLYTRPFGRTAPDGNQTERGGSGRNGQLVAHFMPRFLFDFHLN